MKDKENELEKYTPEEIDEVLAALREVMEKDEEFVLLIVQGEDGYREVSCTQPYTLFRLVGGMLQDIGKEFPFMAWIAGAYTCVMERVTMLREQAEEENRKRMN